MKEAIKEDGTLVFDCPHCHDFIVVRLSELNCKIFRHGVYKATLQQIDPHMPKSQCDALFENELIFGCGKPFQIVIERDIFFVDTCEYI